MKQDSRLTGLDRRGFVVRRPILALKRSGRATGKTELSLAFDTTRLRDGQSGRMAGQVVRIYDSESVKTISGPPRRNG